MVLALGEYLPVRSDPHLHPRRHGTDGAGPVPIRTVQRQDARAFRQTVALQHDEADGPVPPHQVGRDGRRAGGDGTRTVEADHPAHVREHQPVPEPEPHLDPDGYRTPFHQVLDTLGAAGDRPLEGPAAERCRLPGEHLHAGMDLLPHPGHRGERGGRDLPQVVEDGFDALGEVHHRPAARGTKTETRRSRTWHSGRKHNCSSPSRIDSTRRSEATENMMFSWVIIAPLGGPVVPEV